MTMIKNLTKNFYYDAEDEIWEFLRPATEKGPLLVLLVSHSASYLISNDIRFFLNFFKY